jgi:hypothetical protein
VLQVICFDGADEGGDLHEIGAGADDGEDFHIWQYFFTGETRRRGVFKCEQAPQRFNSYLKF